MKKAILTTVVGAVILAVFAGNALAYEFIVESRPGGKNYDRYTDNLLDSSAKSAAAGCTSGIGSRYSGSTAATATFSFTAPESGNYEVSVTWGISDKGDTSVPCRIYHDGGYTDKILNQSYPSGGGHNKWNLQGTFYMVGGTIYTVVLTNPTLESAVSPARLMSDSVKWYIACGCGNVPAVSTQVPHMPGDTVVRVKDIDSTASLVSVYVNGALAGTASPGGAPTADVTLSAALVANDLVVATQTMLACDPPVVVEGCKATTGPLAGTCAQVAAVTALPILINGDTSVVVSGVDASATAVSVYAGGVGPAIGVLNNPVPAAPDNRVTVSLTRALANGEVVSATQTLQSVGGSGLTQEGCIPGTGPLVGDCNQVGAVRATGMLDAGRTQIWVTDVTAGATAVKVYANDALIGTNNAPTSPMTAVPVTALVEGQTIKATQVVRLEGCLPSTGHRVMAAGLIDDFQDDIVTANTIPVLSPPAERTWYDAADNYYSESLQREYPTGGSRWLCLADHGWGNGIYAVYDAIIPPDVAPGSQYHLTMDMILDERGTVDTDYWGYNGAPFEIGVVVNGAHRAIGTPLAAISPAGKYPGKMTPQQDGCDIEPSVTAYGVTLTVNPGDSLLIAFASTCSTYSISKSASPASYPGMLIDNIKLNVGPKPCLPQDVPAVGVTAASATMPLQAGATEVKVTGIDVTATQVSVYEYTPNPDTWTLIGTATNLGGAASALVTLTQPLVAHTVVVATQTMTVCDPPQVMEGEKPTIGPVVGTGKNSPLLLSLGVREVAVPAGGCVIGTDGGTTGGIEWIGPSSTVSGAPQGKLLNPSTEWQTVTFDPASDPVLSFNAGNGVLDGACNVFEHLALASTATNTGAYTVLIDNVKSGTTVVEDFESYLAGDAAMFNTPNYSGTTSANLLLPDPSIATVVAEGDASNQSLKVVFQYKDEDARRWLRLVTSAVANRPNPIIDITQPISMRIKFTGASCNDPFADADNDDDVDQADFAAFQACFSGSGNDLVSGCECFDRDDDGDIDSDDAGAFEACASGPGIAADANCD